MTTKQLEQIKEFSLTFYEKNDQFHDVRHAQLTVTYALSLATHYSQVNLLLLEAVCWLHDIGRVHVDEGHPEESAKLAVPFLETIGIDSEEKKQIIHAVEIHGVKRIHEATTIEAKILFDADKIQQLSVFGFLRMAFFFVSQKNMDMLKVMDYMWERTEHLYNNIQTPQAKEMLTKETQKIKEIVTDFKHGFEGKL